MLEPVGAHPAHRRLGLARATMLEALWRLKARGMEKAIVCVEDGDEAARQLYTGLGFSVATELHTYAKIIAADSG